MKKCSKCGIERDILEFNKNLARKDGISGQCRECIQAINRANYYKDLEASRARSRVAKHAKYHKDPEASRAKSRVAWRARHSKNPEKINARQRARHAANSEKENAKQRARYAANPEKVTASLRALYETDLDFKLCKLLRNRLRKALTRRGAKKQARTMELVGCPDIWLEIHLGSLFKPGMTWENYGPVWHVDHKRPCASFDLTDLKQQKACFHWTNLQPLFALENLKKSDKYDSSPEPENHSVAQ